MSRIDKYGTDDLTDPRVYQCMRTGLLISRYTYHNSMGVRLLLSLLVWVLVGKTLLFGFVWIDAALGMGLLLCLRQLRKLHLYLIGVWGKELLEMDREAAHLALRTISNLAVEGKW